MSQDPRKGKSAIINQRSQRKRDVKSTTLDLAFDLFYGAKRSEGVRTRTLSDYRSYWRYFRRWLTENYPDVIEVKQITSGILRAYSEYMSFEHKRYGDDIYRKKDDRKLSPVTVASRLRALQTMCKFWATEGIVDVNSAEKVKAPRKDVEEKTIFTDEQLTALLEAPNIDTFAGYRDRTLMMLLADSGLRINEALSLEESHIDFSARCIRLPSSLNKNRKPRIIPLSAPVIRELIKLLEENRAYFDTNHVFVANYGSPLKADHFRKRLRNYAVEAGIDTKETAVTPHRFRDYFCTNYLLNGGELYTLQRIVAHADIKTTQGYVKPNEGAIRDNHSQYSPLSKLGISRVVKRR